jgi:hypothetical protein
LEMKHLVRASLVAAALALPSLQAQAAPTWAAGVNSGLYTNYEAQWRSTAACAAFGGCLAFNAANDPVGYQRIDPNIAGNVAAGDIFAGILSVQNIFSQSLGTDVWFQSAGDRFTGYFAQQVLSVVIEGGANAHISLVAPAVDPFGVLAAGEMFRLYSSNANPFENNGTTFDDIAKATGGTFWASLGLGTEGYAYTHTNLAALVNASNTESFSGLDLIVLGAGYNAGILSKVNDINENELGGVTAGFVCSAAELANPAIRCVDIVGTAELELNSAFPTGASPWIYRSNDPFELYKVPEPGTLGLLGIVLSLMGLGALRRRRS